MFGWLRRIFNKAPAPTILDLTSFAGTVYAIGDIHGCLDQLKGLEALIFKDADADTGPKLLVYMGDMVDRGPNSFGVIEHLMRPPPDAFQRICLLGNHEQMMLDFIAKPQQNWLDFGGRETLMSYGASASDIHHISLKSRKIRFLLDRIIPEEHVAFIAGSAHAIKLNQFFLSHAGINPKRSVDKQSIADLCWGSPDFLNWKNNRGAVIVHGHYVTDRPQNLNSLVSIDTAAHKTGRLSAAKLGMGGKVDFFTFHNAIK